MASEVARTLIWKPTTSSRDGAIGLEHLLLAGGSADSVVIGVDEEHGPFRLAYRLRWSEAWLLRQAELTLATERCNRSLTLCAAGEGRWRDGEGRSCDELDGCVDLDIWPTPFTNSFPIRRQPLAIGERRIFKMAYVFGPDLTVRPQRQAYTRLDTHRYLFESLDGSGFSAELPVDEDGIVLDYPGLFERVHCR